jgi:protein ImuB
MNRFACLYLPPASDGSLPNPAQLLDMADAYSPRAEQVGNDLVVFDIKGLARMFGTAEAIGAALRRDAVTRGIEAHVAIAGTRVAALVLARARPGPTIVAPGDEAAALAPLPIEALERLVPSDPLHDFTRILTSWGVRTLGELAAMPSADLAARLGQTGRLWQAMARGEDRRPLVPRRPEERFEASLDLDWPIDGLEPLSFVLTRLLEPLALQLERRDRGAAVVHVVLRLVSREIHQRSLQLPSPIRDARTLRTLALLDLESHPPAAAIDRVTIVIDPTPGRVLQHTLFAHAHPKPESLSTLLARLGALMGSDRIGAPAALDTDRPGAFAMRPFRTDWSVAPSHPRTSAPSHPRVCVVSALRRCRHPVPARVALQDGRPVRVTTERSGFEGGGVRTCTGPWRTSGDWWTRGWNHHEWDVELSTGVAYRIFHDRDRGGWFIDAIAD